MEKTVSDVVTGGFIGGVIVTFFRLLYDHYTSGRTEKGVYMLMAECDKRQKNCDLPYIKAEIQRYAIQCGEYKATTDIRLKDHDKQLDTGREDFDKIIEDMSQIKQALASMPSYADFSKVQDDISKIFQSVARIQTVVEFALDRKDRMNE